MKKLLSVCTGKLRGAIELLIPQFRSLRVLILGAMSIVTLIAMVISFVVMVRRVQVMAVENTVTNTQQVVKQSSVTINSYMKLVSEMARTVSDGVSKLDELSLEIEDYLNTSQNMGVDIKSIVMFGDDGRAAYYAPSEMTIKESTLLQSQRWYIKASGDQEFYFSEPHVQNLFWEQYIWVITVFTSIQVQGRDFIIAIDMDFSFIEDYCKQVNIGGRGYVFLVDPDGKIIYHPQQQMIYAGMKKEDVDYISDREDGVFQYSDEIVMAISSLEETGWRTVGISYLRDAQETTNDIISNLVIVFILVFVVIIIIAAAIAKYISHPIGRIVSVMENAQESQFTNIIHEGAYDEVRRLSHSYNEMTRRIQELMNQIKLEQRELRKTEIKALQAQINPHFLYNTLDSILWMCEKGDSQGAVQMVSSLSTLFRISLNRGREIVTIKEELSHAENYLLIQAIRYKDQFFYKIDAPEYLCKRKIPKILIQPFLENAIYHAFGHSVDKGRIEIRVMEKDDKILIEVEDNGVGMPEEIVEKINMGEISSKSGIGISNVNSRIQIYFGREYGVTIKSIPDQGTCIQMWLPAHFEEGNILE